MPIGDLVTRNASRHPDKLAIKFVGETCAQPFPEEGVLGKARVDRRSGQALPIGAPGVLVLSLRQKMLSGESRHPDHEAPSSRGA